MLTGNRAQVLRLIVADYIDSAIPVGSEQIVKRHGLGLSPATIRNEMAGWRTMATSPITRRRGASPPDRGYRYYVEMLMEEPSVSSENEPARFCTSSTNLPRELGEWLQLAASWRNRCVTLRSSQLRARRSLSSSTWSWSACTITRRCWWLCSGSEGSTTGGSNSQEAATQEDLGRISKS